MKWILLMLLVFYSDPNDSTSSEIYIDKLQSLPKNTRSARTLGYSSEEEDENGIHLHIWNDMSNRKNFYPNLMKHIAEESVKIDTDTTSMVPDTSNSNSNPTHIHFNLNEMMPTPQPQVSAINLLKNALVHTLTSDEFRKSDQNLYESFYKLKTDHRPNAISWNYHPSAVNYIPKTYNTNLNGAMSSSPPIKLPKTSSTAKTTISRPTLREQLHATHNFVQDYYTNLHKIRPKSVIQTVGYEIGGMPKYSGRLLANEPMPMQYRTFKMFEPKPPQIMLPPPDVRIPDFKPVPPRLKIIPVIDEILDDGIELTVNELSKSLPWTLVKIEQKVKPNFPLPEKPKQLQIIPFKLSEAVTIAPFRNYISKTEYSHIEPTTEAYHQILQSPDIETLQSIRTAENQIVLPQSTSTKASKYAGYLPNQYDAQQSNHSNSMFEQISSKHFKTDAKSKMLFNEYNKQYSSDYINTIHKNSTDIVGSTKPVSLENLRSNFTNRTQINNIDFVHAAKRNLNEQTKTMHKPQQQSTDIRSSIDDVMNLNITDRFNSNDNDCNNISDSTQSDRQNMLIDTVPSNAIQFSQTYSRQITNVPQHNQMPTTKAEQDDMILRQVLANDIKKALQTTVNDANPSDHDDASEPRDPFLITVYDETDRTLRDGTYVNDDLQLAEAATKISNSMTGGRNSSIKRLNQKWATDRRDTITDINSDELESDRNTKTESKSINKTKQKELKFFVSNNNNGSNSTSSLSDISNSSNNNNRLIDQKYYKWFSEYRNENKKLGRTIISEHFKKIKIEPNINWIVLPRGNSTTTKRTMETIQHH